MLLSARVPGGVRRKSSTGFWAFCSHTVQIHSANSWKYTNLCQQR